MGDSESEKLCARLTGSVGDRRADVFYQEFNLDKPTVFAEFYFKEMMEIYHFPGMEGWPKVMSSRSAINKKQQGRSPPKIYLSLVCFQPPGAVSSNTASASIKSRVKLALTKARDMVSSCFNTKEDHNCIKVAMHKYPTIAIFMCQVVDQTQELKRKRNTKKDQVRKSILDVKDTSSLHCLAAVNYFTVGQNTVVLWLATTLEKPPVDSIHVTWRNLGLATYLLCMLVKQHTGYGNLADSVISLQSSQNRNDSARSFYMSLGFQVHDEYVHDNGLSQTHPSFQGAVGKKPQLWVSPEREAMSFFQLHCGRLILPDRKVNLISGV